ncbi:signal peptidase I [Nocardioides marmoribigeumensis]|uniref:Signal peptidase I n=1 Tax=Nocardioides marmoribigeumensis TaxID=433649 RepID=A0ABU2BU66_9ACTN|nr:signal peptidase I [Nocardioides marmoribigeumensis]MDR7362170.1 signal peptidase I [Nocardioides marmoribigeumensis]
MRAEQKPRPTGVRRVARWGGNLAILLVIAACATWILPSAFGYSRYVITGGSMTGTYDKGSVVFEKPVAVGDLQVGDVITYMPPPDSGVPHLVTHRILRMEPADGGGVLFTTQGDANPDPDPWHFKLVDTSQPVVQFGVPQAGWVFIALADRDLRMVVIGGPAALVALLALAELVGALRERRKGTTPRGVPATVPSQRTPAPDTVPV